MAAITRTLAISDINPAELAQVFCDMWAEEQAEFFQHVHEIARGWPGAGWCQQSCEIVAKLTPEGREAIKTIAAHLEGGIA